MASKKQRGVRNLDKIPSKPTGKKLPPPPVQPRQTPEPSLWDDWWGDPPYENSDNGYSKKKAYPA